MATTKVHGDPTKAFFVHTITRDIKLEDCILDLIDNSLDAAKDQLGSPAPSLEGKADFSRYWIKVTVAEDKFTITDNCGGISLDDAVNYAFTFGRKPADEPEDYSIGIYGIGMKRAIFKMGEQVAVHSTPAPPAKTKGAPAAATDGPFKVEIDATKWLNARDWDFELDHAPPLPHPGVEIRITKLHENVATEFANPNFETSLRRIIARDYSRFIAMGLKIEVNEKTVKAFEFRLLHSDKIIPFQGNFTIKDVHVEIVAGMAAPPSETNDPDEDGEKEDRSGWYVVCNDRIVVAADKTELTGWGFGGKQRWHPQYRGFLGIILFSAKSADALPLTTTKRSIDRDRQVYKLALAKMVELMRSWIEYTNRRKSAIEEAREIESKATYASAFSIPSSKAAIFPSFRAVAPRAKEVTIQFVKLAEDVRELAIKLGDPGLSAREVGSRSFDYAFREFVSGGE